VNPAVGLIFKGRMKNERATYYSKRSVKEREL